MGGGELTVVWPDQYVIPGNILYKQRGTVWHAGENTILGRTHTIHAAVAGYVKYYRDPLRHAKRQYIGVVFDKNDTLPYPPGAPRTRKFGMVPIPRKEIEVVDGSTVGPSGIPLVVTRREQIDEVAVAKAEAAKAKAALIKVAEPASETPHTFTDGNSVIAALFEQRMKDRAKHDAKRRELRAQQEQELRERMATRVFRLQENYSYRETNWEIGRLVGDAGVVPGTEGTSSRKRKFRNRRRRNNTVYSTVKQAALDKVDRRTEYRKFVWEARIRRAAERATYMADLKAKQAAGESTEAAASPEAKAKDDGKKAKAKSKKVKA